MRSHHAGRKGLFPPAFRWTNGSFRFLRWVEASFHLGLIPYSMLFSGKFQLMRALRRWWFQSMTLHHLQFSKHSTSSFVLAPPRVTMLRITWGCRADVTDGMVAGPRRDSGSSALPNRRLIARPHTLDRTQPNITRKGAVPHLR